MTIEELKEEIEQTDISYPLSSPYTRMYNACVDYINESDNSSLESLFDDYVDDYYVSEYIRANADDLPRLYYFLADADLRDDLFKLDAYDNLQNIDTTDLEMLKSDILAEIEDIIDADAA